MNNFVQMSDKMKAIVQPNTRLILNHIRMLHVSLALILKAESWKESVQEWHQIISIIYEFIFY